MLTFWILFHPLIYADEISQLLKCQTTSDGNNLLYCEVDAQTLFEAQPYDSMVSLTYDFSCTGGDIPNLGVQSLDSHEFQSFKFGNKDILTISGKGPFVVVDKDPNWTRFVHLSLTCKLSIILSQISPSQSVIDQWLDKKNRLESEIKNHHTSQQAFHELSALIQAIKAIESLFEMKQVQAENSSEIRKQIIQSIKCNNDQSIDECNLLDNILLSDSVLISAEEKRAVSKLNFALQSWMDASDDCNTLPLTALLSVKQQQVIKDMVLNKQKLLENENNYRHFQSLEVTAKKELRELWCLAKNRIPWEGESYGDCY